jgi:GAF domain
MAGFAQPDDRLSSSNPTDRDRDKNKDKNKDMDAGTSPSSAGAASDASNRNRTLILEEQELDSALQLLVERALYITGATGAALALPHGDGMVCRASAGPSAPAVGVRLQVLSGLTGESIARRQLLRCDNAETDPRVNLEACRALGIASIVVLPLFRENPPDDNPGDNTEVRGLIELFSDHPYAFEERDLVALERMADLTTTALDLADQRRHTSTASSPRRQELGRAPESAPARAASASQCSVRTNETQALPDTNIRQASMVTVQPDLAEHLRRQSSDPPALAAPSSTIPPTSSEPQAIPEAMRRVQKCESCGFPVSDGRSICLDCERKNSAGIVESKSKANIMKPERDASSPSAAPTPEEFIPAFLAKAELVKPSWFSNPINLLAIFVLILGILVAIVVFR